jgi:hypothetical protein
MNSIVVLPLPSFATTVANAQAGRDSRGDGPGKDSPKDPNAPTTGTKL